MKKKLRELLMLAEDELWLDFECAAAFTHNGMRGKARETPLERFLQYRLPGRYCIDAGKVVDYLGNQSGQIDLFIYDGSSTCPLLNQQKGQGILLAAEALLATIEVKTKLNSEEMKRSVEGIKQIHELRPWGAPWAVSRKGGLHADDQQPRVFTSLFAYQTNFGAKDWAQKEYERIKDQAKLKEVPLACMDRVVVLDRGLLLPESGNVAQPGQGSGVLGLWYFSLINFLDREVKRRREFPWARYETREKGVWRTLS